VLKVFKLFISIVIPAKAETHHSRGLD